MQQFAKDYFNEAVAKVFGVILKIADKSCDTMDEATSSAFRLGSPCPTVR